MAGQQGTSQAETSPRKNQRLLALDILRGLDIFFLTVVGPLFWAANRVWGMPEWLRTQFTHVQWEGLTAWDLIMPWFIFMCGAAIPFALPKRLVTGRAGWAFWKHVLGRVLLLWILGMAVQGNLLTLDWTQISFYNNTLQTIAAGYLIAAVVLLVPCRKMRVLMPFLLAGFYGVLLAWHGDYTPADNAAIRVERFLLPSSTGDYSWCLTTLMFGAMTLCGMLFTELLRAQSVGPWRKIGSLAGIGGALLCGGLLLGMVEPAIKRIFTVSFTLQAMGWGVLALSLCYLVADVLHVQRGWGLLTLYGRHALLAYLTMELFHPVIGSAASILTQGFPNLLGARGYPLVHAVVVALLMTLLLLLRERWRKCHG